MSAVEAEKKAAEETKVEEKGGELLFCGATCWDIIGRKKGAQEGNLISPTRLRPLVGVDIRVVASGSSSCHCVALDVEGRCYTWGRNERGQLGQGDTIQRDRPTVVSELSKYKLIRAGAGRSHSVVVTEDGLSLAFGWNKHGQLGSGSTRNEIESSPVRCLVSDVKTTACGADFTVWLSSVEGASILSAGLPQYGQLGHGTDKEYNTKDSSVRLAYEPQPRPRAIASLAGETIVKVACGTNHTVAVDSNGHVYTWGFGGYGRLGHREQKDEWVPRRVDIFSKHNVLPPGAVISAGSVNSACTAGGGQLYMWGKIKNTGDDWMYPKPLMDLSGWNLRCMDSGNMHHFVGADNSCISWGHAQNGELGYGPNGQKSSAVPKKVDILEGMHVIGVACGVGHSMVIVDRTHVGDGLDQVVGSLGVKIMLSKVGKRVLPKILLTLERGSQKIHQNLKKRIEMMKVMLVMIKSMARQKRRANVVERLLAGVKVEVEKNLHPLERVLDVGRAALHRQIKSQILLWKKLVREEGHAGHNSQFPGPNRKFCSLKENCAIAYINCSNLRSFFIALYFQSSIASTSCVFFSETIFMGWLLMAWRTRRIV